MGERQVPVNGVSYKVLNPNAKSMLSQAVVRHSSLSLIVTPFLVDTLPVLQSAWPTRIIYGGQP